MQLHVTITLSVLFSALIVSVPGSQARLPVQVNGLLHGAVTMSNPWNNTRNLSLISWKFSKNGNSKAFLDTSKQPHKLYDTQFSGRLEVADSLMTVTVKNVRKEDSGTFISDITYEDGTSDRFSYNVTIYEPVTQPAIRIEWENRTSDWCNMTLHCSVPTNTSALSYTWMYRHRDSEYQLYNNGDTIQVSLPPTFWDMELLCVVHNPADQKNVSRCVQEGCRSATGDNRNHHVILIIVSCILLVLVISVVMKICISRRKRAKECLNPSDNRNGESEYIEVTSTREDLDNQIPPVLLYDVATAPQTTKAQTIYTTLQHPKPK